MLALRLARGSHPLVLLRRLLVAAASAGVGFLLLCTLGYAVGHPGQSQAALMRLAWCALPLAATVHFAVAVARTDPATRPRPGLSAIGLGPARLAAVAAASTAVSCTLGSTVALAVFLHLRGDLTGLPFDGAAAELLGAGRPLPLAAALTLLAIVPVVASTSAALTLRPSRKAVLDDEPDTTEPVPAAAPAGLPWGVSLIALGLALETYAARGTDALPPAGGFGGGPAGVLVGWALTALGLAVAGPGLTYLSGRLLQTFRPGVTRLLAGRALMDEARRVGRPLGVAAAVAATTIGASAVYGADGPHPFGPLTGMGAALVMACTTATLLTAALESRQTRVTTKDALLRLGASAALLRLSVALRALTLLTVFAPLTWLVAELAALPLRS
ncbi:hypothetical protein E2C00_30650 [Streptomyces sp. WAC05374]|uniref:hypothetical protein n=1 Tax=Streptomyces sp. WAC05374 TaxID=2487420 RepID=UPI000F860CBC|nr:hypothetical protein [Streptomyces sp. WAC05374]RST15612.1 hypothetical protein EF905_14465 [Streptomyces sp. WAC05374]TDF38885.1 hypothetical protein E2B92_27040 [Streptomyces sp. WAC05374]TDF46800.1 hypothetical protein E2C02_31105 [Streptomyces sp. WAC05374]TDF48796.1 hypothetical protein E2C00_30650 [Streptomyces sp. WAC05374]